MLAALLVTHVSMQPIGTLHAPIFGTWAAMLLSMCLLPSSLGFFFFFLGFKQRRLEVSVACARSACSVGGWPATEPFLAGGFGGLLYQKMLQAGVDALPAGAAPSLGQVAAPNHPLQLHAAAASACRHARGTWVSMGAVHIWQTTLAWGGTAVSGNFQGGVAWRPVRPLLGCP